MAAEAITGWLKTRKRKGVVSSAFYSAAALTGGALVFLLIVGFVFAAAKIFMLTTNPSGTHADVWSAALAVLVAVLLVVDSVRSRRDDFSIVPLWFAREYLHIGPRMVREGYGAAVHAWQLSRLDVKTCADVLAYLSTKTTPTFKEELRRAFPGLDWLQIGSQLQLLGGVLFFRSGAPRVTLLTPLRLELRRLLAHKAAVPPPLEEPEAIPVQAPEKLSPCDILGVAATASLAEIKVAYRKRVKECHPDHFAGMDERSRELAEEWTKALNAAYETLKGERTGSRAN